MRDQEAKKGGAQKNPSSYRAKDPVHGHALLRDGLLRRRRPRRGRGKQGWKLDAAAWAVGLWRALGRRYSPDKGTNRGKDNTEFKRFAFRWLRLLGVADAGLILANLLRAPAAEPRPNPYRPVNFGDVCAGRWRPPAAMAVRLEELPGGKKRKLVFEKVEQK